MSRRTFGALLGASALTAGCANFNLSEEETRTVRFATWNIAAAAPLYFGRGLRGVTKWIVENDMDICALQEVDRFAKTSNYVDFPAYMAGETGFHTFYGHSSLEPPHAPGRPRRHYGNLLLSRFPMPETLAVFLDEGPHAPENLPEWGTDKRRALFAKVAVPGQEFWIATTHLSNTVSPDTHIVRKYQAMNLMHHFNEHVSARVPFVIGGDFNTAAASHEMMPFYNNGLASHTGSIGPTFPLDHRLAEQNMQTSIDHIFSRAVRVGNVRKHAFPELSDHAGVSADIILRVIKAP